MPGAEVFYLPPGFSWDTIPAAQREQTQDPEYLNREFGKKLVADAEGRCTVPVGDGSSVVARRDGLFGHAYVRRDSESPFVIHMRPDKTLRVKVLECFALGIFPEPFFP